MSTVAEPTTGAVVPRRAEIVRWLGIYSLLVIMAGVLGGILWSPIAGRPEWVMQDNGSAVIAERGMAAYFAMDAWFVLIGLVVGVGLGAVAFRWFRPLGWFVTVIAAAGAVVSSGAALAVGWLLGPGPLDARLAVAQKGDHVPIDFQLHAWSAIAVWPFAAMIPILILASVLADPQDPAKHTILTAPVASEAEAKSEK